MNLPSSALLALTLGLLGSPALARADWLQFRGPQAGGQGHEAALFPHPEPRLDWKAELPGRGLSSPIVVGDRVFVTCSSGPGERRLHLLCFRAADGVKLWERQFIATGRTLCQEKTAVAAPSPVSDGVHVLAVFSSGDALCVDLDGTVRWFRAFGQDYPNASNSLGMASSPVYAGGLFVVPLETDVESLAVGVDPVTGVNRWKLDRPKRANWTSPVVDSAGGGAVVYLQSSAGVHAVEAATGKVRWAYTEGASTIPSSALSDRLLLVPSHGLTALQTAGEALPKQVWRSGPLRPGTASPLAVKDRVYLVNDAGVLTCGDVAEGKRVWQVRLEGPFSASPVAAGPWLLLVNEKGLLQVVDVTKPEGEVVGRLDLQETILGTPALSHGALFVRGHRYLYRVAGGR